MKFEHLQGSIVAMVTPFCQDGSVNFDMLTELLERQIAAGTDGILTLGTTGEYSTMSHEEDAAVVEHTIRVVDGRVPVMVGSGSNCTVTQIEKSRLYQSMGADALLQVTPYYNKASQEGLVRHFTQVADHVSIPILLYNVPSRTGVTIQPETYRILSEHPNIRGTKEASGNLSLIARTAALCGQGFDIYSGNDDQTVPIMSLGGKGVVSVLANIMPKETHKMCRLYLDGDVKESRRMQLQLLEIMEALFWDVNPIPVKTALGLMGVCGDDLRLPLTPMEPEQRERLAEVMKRQGISLKKELHNQTNLL